MKFSHIALVALVTNFGAIGTAHAGDVQLSAGGSYLFDSADTDFSFTTATVRGAYFFSDTFGVEVEGAFGLGSTDYGNSSIEFDLKNQFGGYAVSRLPVGKSGEVFGRLGWTAGKVGVTSGSRSGDFDYNGFSIGGGYTHYFGDGLGLRGEITTSGADLDGNFGADGNLTSAAVSLVYKFGTK